MVRKEAGEGARAGPIVVFWPRAWSCPGGCVWASQLGSECEDAADEIVKELAKEALGRTLSSCAELKDIVGACDHDMAKKHCPASCGLCEPYKRVDNYATHRRQMNKCA